MKSLTQQPHNQDTQAGPHSFVLKCGRCKEEKGDKEPSFWNCHNFVLKNKKNHVFDKARPKPLYGRQGLAGSWGKVTVTLFITQRGSQVQGVSKNWVLPNWAFADPASNWGEIPNEICGKSSCIMLWVGNFNAFIGRFADTALGAYRVWKGALKNKRLHKNKWFLKIIQTGINPTTPDLTGSTGFVTKNHNYFSPITSRICKCFIWQNSVFFWDTL